MLKHNPGARGRAGRRTCQCGGPSLVTLQGHRLGSGRVDAEEEAWAIGGSSGAQKWGGGWRLEASPRPSVHSKGLRRLTPRDGRACQLRPAALGGSWAGCPWKSPSGGFHFLCERGRRARG